MIKNAPSLAALLATVAGIGYLAVKGPDVCPPMPEGISKVMQSYNPDVRRPNCPSPDLASK